jgi:hypothetical protein
MGEGRGSIERGTREGKRERESRGRISETRMILMKYEGRHLKRREED